LPWQATRIGQEPAWAPRLAMQAGFRGSLSDLHMIKVVVVVVVVVVGVVVVVVVFVAVLVLVLV
jgi:Flp pilus assembly protein TadB